jgi:hypothetical protein
MVIFKNDPAHVAFLDQVFDTIHKIRRADLDLLIYTAQIVHERTS